METRPMTFDELQRLIREAAWFADLGGAELGGGIVCIPNLEPWAGVSTGDSELEAVADQMAWLPSSRDQIDPIHLGALRRRIEASDAAEIRRERVMEAYRTALSTLRRFDGHPLLRVGPHDLTEAARGAAMFAVRHAAMEAILEEPAFWCRVMEIYSVGRWPCGTLPDGRLVVL